MILPFMLDILFWQLYFFIDHFCHAAIGFCRYQMKACLIFDIFEFIVAVNIDPKYDRVAYLAALTVAGDCQFEED